MKTCSKCKQYQSFDLFYKNKRSKTGFSSWCKKCVSDAKIATYWENPEKYRKLKRTEYVNNRDVLLKRVKINQKNANERRKVRYATDEAYRNNILKKLKSENHKKLVKKWIKSNKSRMTFHCSNRRSLKKNATPPWLTSIHYAQIQEMYDVAYAKSVQTGISYHVDHIFPLNGIGFNGLHVPWNLQILPAHKNISKGNKMPFEFQHLGWSN